MKMCAKPPPPSLSTRKSVVPAWPAGPPQMSFTTLAMWKIRSRFVLRPLELFEGFAQPETLNPDEPPRLYLRDPHVLPASRCSRTPFFLSGFVSGAFLNAL